MFFSFSRRGIIPSQTYIRVPSWCNSDSRSLPPALHKFGFQPKLVLQIFNRGTCLSRLFDNPNNGVTAFDRPLSNHVIDFSGSAIEQKGTSSQSGTGFSVLSCTPSSLLSILFLVGVGYAARTLMYLKLNFTDLAPVFWPTTFSQRRPILHFAHPLQVAPVHGLQKCILKTSQ